MISKKEVKDKLNIMYPNPVCELNFNKDYELLIATVLSAHSTDKIVNRVTKELFKKDIYSLAKTPLKEIEVIIKSVGSYTRKAFYVSEIANSLIKNYNGKVPNDREYLESLPGVGRKTCNVVLANLYNEPTMAVDTHVSRVSVRLGLAKENDTLKEIENKLMKTFSKDYWNRINDQMVLFGRYTCKSIKPNCEECLFNDKCKFKRI